MTDPGFPHSRRPHVVVLGGGFARLYAARGLLHRQAASSRQFDLTVVSTENFMLYTPLLPEVAGGRLAPSHAVLPQREALRGARLVVGEAENGDPARGTLKVRTRAGREADLRFDHLLVAVGSVARSLPVEGLLEHAVGFKSLSDAVTIGDRLVQHLEAAEAADDPAELRALLTFVFGAGYAGVEGLAELQDYARRLIPLYPRARDHGLRFVLIDAGRRIMAETDATLAAHTMRRLRRRGIEIRANMTVQRVGSHQVELADGTHIPTCTVVWTAGVRPHPVVERLGLPLASNGRIAVSACLRVNGCDRVWAAGDAAAVPDPGPPDRSAPPTAQHALREGRLAAPNIVAALNQEPLRPFPYHTRGAFVDIGRRDAVAQTFGVRWRGLPAWGLARGYHLWALPGRRRSARLLADWLLELMIPREAAELASAGTPVALPEPPQAPRERHQPAVRGRRVQLGARRVRLGNTEDSTT